MPTQTSHFFDRVPASDGVGAGFARVYVMRDDTSGRYYLSDSQVVAGSTQVYFQDEGDGRVHLDDADPTHIARMATRFGDVTVQL